MKPTLPERIALMLLALALIGCVFGYFISYRGDCFWGCERCPHISILEYLTR